MIDKLRWAAAPMLLVAALWLFLWQRGYYIDVGQARVQARWDAQRFADTQAALADEANKRRQEQQKRQEAERIANENHRLQEALIERNRAAVERERGLLDHLNELDARLAEQERTSADAIAAATAREARTAAQLLGRCTSRYRTVAAAADELKNQVMGLQDYANHVCPAQSQQEQQ